MSVDIGGKDRDRTGQPRNSGRPAGGSPRRLRANLRLSPAAGRSGRRAVEQRSCYRPIERRECEFGELFDPALGVAVLVVTLLAVLELAREALLEITQSESFAPIYIRIAHVEPS